jgi:hypothetical protein
MDATARLIAENIRDAIGGTVVVENKPGAALRLALYAVRDAKPDGATMLYTAVSPFTIYPHVYRKLGYDPDALVPVVPAVSFDYALGVAGSSASDPGAVPRGRPSEPGPQRPSTLSPPRAPGPTSSARRSARRPGQADARSLQGLRSGDAGPARRSGSRLLQRARRIPALPSVRPRPDPGDDGRRPLAPDSGRAHVRRARPPQHDLHRAVRHLRARGHARGRGRQVERRRPRGGAASGGPQRLAELGYTPLALGPAEFRDEAQGRSERWGPSSRRPGSWWTSDARHDRLPAGLAGVARCPVRARAADPARRRRPLAVPLRSDDARVGLHRRR